MVSEPPPNSLAVTRGRHILGGCRGGGVNQGEHAAVGNGFLDRIIRFTPARARANGRSRAAVNAGALPATINQRRSGR